METFNAEPYRVGSFSALDEILPSLKVRRDGPTWELDKGELPALTYHFEGRDYTIEDYLQRRRVTGFLVLHDGRVLFERYQYGRDANQRFVSFSMAKSITSLLVGQALERGMIKSLDDPVSAYAKDLASGPYGAITIRQLLHMSSGLRANEDYADPSNDVNEHWDAMFRLRRGGDPAYVLKRPRPKEAEPGSRFKYTTMESQVLCYVLHGATRRTVADITEEWLWKPLGAEADASWLVGWNGVEYCGGGFNARLRDYARLGWLLARGGERTGEPIVAKAYVLDATDPQRQPPGFRVNEAGRGFGYGFQFWLGGQARPAFALLGVYGQSISVVPSTGLVVVQTAVWPTASDEASRRERTALFNAIDAAVAALPR